MAAASTACAVGVLAAPSELQRLYESGQYGASLQLSERVLREHPKDVQGRFVHGMSLAGLGRTQAAVDALTQLSIDRPDLPEVHNNLAVLLAQQQQYDKARLALEKAIRAHPTYATVQANLSEVYGKLASQAYGKALPIERSAAPAPVPPIKLAMFREIDSLAQPAKPGGPALDVAVATAATGQGAAPAAPPSKPAAPPAPEPKPAPPKPVTSAPVADAKPQPKPPVPAPTTEAAAPAKPAEPSPAEQARRAEAAAREDITRALSAWMSAWSAKDMRAYFAAYAPDFSPPSGIGRAAWEQERKDRIAGKPGRISVRHEAPQIRLEGDRALVRFRQHYSAPGLNTTSTKTALFVRQGGRWLIKEEAFR